jgi:hypothetical protein
MAFNNPGIMIPLADAADEPDEAFARVSAINLRGEWACKAVPPATSRNNGSMDTQGRREGGPPGRWADGRPCRAMLEAPS